MSFQRERECAQHGVVWVVAKAGEECPLCKAERERRQLRHQIEALRERVGTPNIHIEGAGR